MRNLKDADHCVTSRHSGKCLCKRRCPSLRIFGVYRTFGVYTQQARERKSGKSKTKALGALIVDGV